MKTTICAAILAVSLAGASAFGAPAVETSASTNITFVIPVKGIMESGMLYALRLGFKQADELGAATIVFDMDTPGGSVDVVEEIIRRLINLPTNVHTVTFVNKDALSAGALMALATDEIYMSPGSRIGASAMVTLTGDIPDGDTKEKHVSSTLALVTSAAKRKGHDTELLRAMVRKDVGYTAGTNVICPKGELLTLTDDVAGRQVERDGKQVPLLSAGTLKTLDDVLAKIGSTPGDVRHQTLSSSEKLARYVKLMSVLFLLGGILGIYIEIKTPGFGLPGVLGVFSLAIFLWAHFVAGEAGSIEILLLIVGLMFVILEIFLLPGLGFLGVTGAALMVVALVMAMVEHYPGGSWFEVPTIDLHRAFFNLGVSLVASFAAAATMAHYLPKTAFFHHLALMNTMDHKDGFHSAPETTGFVGLRGRAITELRPGGIGQFGDRRLDVITRGEFLDQGAAIIIAETHGSRIVVDAMAPIEGVADKTAEKEKG
jgi:membrane-bound serine protease (ClpP class)